MTPEDFVRLVRDELALPVATGDLENDLDQVVSWNSIQVVRLVAALEKETGHRVPVSKVLEERTLRGIYATAAQP